MKKLWKPYSLFLLLYGLAIVPTQSQTQMEKKTSILIHGSWHSAWNWHKVVPLLEKNGHTAFALDLPGMGRDKTPIQHVTLEMSVARICELIDQIDGKSNFGRTQ